MARLRKHPVTNRSLADLLERTGWTMAEAAKRINKRAGENGLCLTYRASSVSHWLTGVQPRSEAIPIIVEAFASALDLPELTADELGWPVVERKASGSPWLEDPLTCLATLARSDALDPHGSAASDVYSAAHLSVIPPSTSVGPVAGSSRLSRSSRCPDIRRTRASAAELLRMYELFGGCHLWPASSSLLANNVVPLVRSATGPGGFGLFSAVSEFVYVVGMIAEDAGAQGRAQKYYILALRLANEAGDLVARAILLFRLALQAIQADFAHMAEELLDTLATTVIAHPSLRVASTNLRALAHARAGNRREAMASLAAADRESQEAETAPELDWVKQAALPNLSHLRGQTLMALGDLAGAASYLADSLAAHDSDKHRSRALVGIRLARVQVRKGRIERAAASMRAVADDIHAVSSAPVETELAAFRNAWPLSEHLLPMAACVPRLGTPPLWPIGPQPDVGRALPPAETSGNRPVGAGNHVRVG